MSGSTELIVVARAQAIFNSGLPTDSTPTRSEVTDAVRWAVRAYGGTRACAAEVAYAYGDRPDTAVHRMSWACGVARTVGAAA